MSLRVLLADESASIKKVFQLGLQDFAAEVKSVQSGVDVIEVAEAFQPHIIFADILLQKKNGYDVCLELKQHPSLNPTPLVLMWSSFMELDQKKYMESGAQGEIEKPFEVDAMRNLIQQLVPSLKEQNLAAFLKFPTSITQEFVEEEKHRQPPEPAQPAGSMDVISIAPVPSTPDLTPPPPAQNLAAPPQAPESFEDSESVFNQPEGHFEFETQEPELPPETIEEPIFPAAPEATPAEPDPMDFTQWKVEPEAIAPVEPKDDIVESFGEFEVTEPEGWQSTQLNSLKDETPTEIPAEMEVDGFESVDISADASEPLDLESFLYKPDEEQEPNTPEDPPVVMPAVGNVVVRSIDGDEFEEPKTESPLDLEQIEKLVADQVAKQLSSDGIEALVRAHAQEVIKLNIVEQLPQMIERIAREELDKLLKIELEGTSES